MQYNDELFRGAADSPRFGLPEKDTSFSIYTQSMDAQVKLYAAWKLAKKK